VDAGYYPRQAGEKGELSKNDRREQRKRKAGRIRLEGEGSENIMETMETQISDLRSQLDRPAQIIVAKDNDLEKLDKEIEKLEQAYNRWKQRMRQIGGYAVEGRSLASLDRSRRGQGANVTNGDQTRQTLT